jgi:hypothetical protein
MWQTSSPMIVVGYFKTNLVGLNAMNAGGKRGLVLDLKAAKFL